MAELADAVAASCAIPASTTPVEIDGAATSTAACTRPRTSTWSATSARSRDLPQPDLLPAPDPRLESAERLARWPATPRAGGSAARRRSCAPRLEVDPDPADRRATSTRGPKRMSLEHRDRVIDGATGRSPLGRAARGPRAARADRSRRGDRRGRRPAGSSSTRPGSRTGSSCSADPVLRAERSPSHTGTGRSGSRARWRRCRRRAAASRGRRTRSTSHGSNWRAGAAAQLVDRLVGR